MEDYALVEADFQQYYQLDVADVPFMRYARLFESLPRDSRITNKHWPLATWTWEKEITSRILYELSLANAYFYNANIDTRKTKPAEPPEILRPDYVNEANKANEEAEKKRAQEDLIEMRDFWNARNPGIQSV